MIKIKNNAKNRIVSCSGSEEDLEFDRERMESKNPKLEAAVFKAIHDFMKTGEVGELSAALMEILGVNSALLKKGADRCEIDERELADKARDLLSGLGEHTFYLERLLKKVVIFLNSQHTPKEKKQDRPQDHLRRLSRKSMAEGMGAFRQPDDAVNNRAPLIDTFNLGPGEAVPSQLSQTEDMGSPEEVAKHFEAYSHRQSVFKGYLAAIDFSIELVQEDLKRQAQGQSRNKKKKNKKGGAGNGHQEKLDLLTRLKDRFEVYARNYATKLATKPVIGEVYSRHQALPSLKSANRSLYTRAMASGDAKKLEAEIEKEGLWESPSDRAKAYIVRNRIAVNALLSGSRIVRICTDFRGLDKKLSNDRKVSREDHFYDLSPMLHKEGTGDVRAIIQACASKTESLRQGELIGFFHQYKGLYIFYIFQNPSLVQAQSPASEGAVVPTSQFPKVDGLVRDYLRPCARTVLDATVAPIAVPLDVPVERLENDFFSICGNEGIILTQAANIMFRFSRIIDISEIQDAPKSRLIVLNKFFSDCVLRLVKNAKRLIKDPVIFEIIKTILTNIDELLEDKIEDRVKRPTLKNWSLIIEDAERIADDILALEVFIEEGVGLEQAILAAEVPAKLQDLAGVEITESGQHAFLFAVLGLLKHFTDKEGKQKGPRDTRRIAVSPDSYFEHRILAPLLGRVLHRISSRDHKEFEENLKSQDPEVVVMDVYPNNTTAREVVAQDVKKLKEKVNPGRAKKSKILILDITTLAPNNTVLKTFLDDKEIQGWIRSALLCIIMPKSDNKFTQLGMDLRQMGHLTYIGAAHHAFIQNLRTAIDEARTPIPEDQRRVQAWFYTQAQDDIIQHAGAITKNTDSLYRELVKLEPSEDSDRFLRVNKRDPEIPFIGLDLGRFMESLNPYIPAEERQTSLEQLVILVRTYIARCQLKNFPIEERVSFGFPESNIADTAHTLRLCVGREEPDIRDQYLQALLSLNDMLMEGAKDQGFLRELAKSLQRPHQAKNWVDTTITRRSGQSNIQILGSLDSKMTFINFIEHLRRPPSPEVGQTPERVKGVVKGRVGRSLF